MKTHKTKKQINTILQKATLLTLGLGLSGIFSACAPSSKNDKSYEKLAQKTFSKVACEDFEMTFWDGLKDFILEQEDFPNAQELEAVVKVEAEKWAHQNQNISTLDLEDFHKNLLNLYSLVIAETQSQSENPQEMLLLLSAIDVGDRSTPFKAHLRDLVDEKITALTDTVQKGRVTCASKASEESSTSEKTLLKIQSLTPSNQTLLSPAVWGARLTVATAYQSCIPKQINPLTASSPWVEGISIVGKHRDGIGNKRKIASLSSLQKTHPYLSKVSTYPSQCINVKKNPLIYDYGGKPHASTSSSSPLNLFKNNGDGGSHLGIDCSGFTFTSYATAGLKMKSNRPLKASDSWAWGSTSYLDPAGNGMTCLDKATLTPGSSLKAGDIIAVRGHVLIVDRVGTDPFGISRAKKLSDCEKMTSSGFDFTLVQSSSSKGGIGINYYTGRDYLASSSKFKKGLEAYAYYACRSKFKGISYQPQIGTLSVVRHKGTSSCKAQRVVLTGESCVEKCKFE